MERFLGITSIVFMLLFANTALSQDKAAYQIYNKKGKKISYTKMLKQLQKADVILFGEIHNNPICHWLQLEVSTDLLQVGPISMGAEMFERDDEESFQQYLTGEIDVAELKEKARLWKNFKTDYQPLVDLAKDNQFPFVGTNIPRRFANMVYSNGFEALDTLSEEEKSWIAPLPIDYDPEIACYKNMLTMVPGHGGPNFPKAQAIKDATMAHFILENYDPGRTFIHFHGTYHSDNFESILWYLLRQRPELSYVTISSVSQADISRLEEEHNSKADFILVIPDRMTKTY